MEKVRHYDISSLLRTEKSYRYAQTAGITLPGRRNQDLQDRQDSAVALAKEMRTTHAKWVEEKFQPLLPYLQSNKERAPDTVAKAVEKNYTKGLETTIALVSRSTKNSYNLQDTITAYTGRFIRMIRTCKELGIDPESALLLAKNSSLLDSRSVAKLLQKYETLPRNVILYEAQNNPIKADSALNKHQKKIQELSADSRYQNIPQNLLAFAVMSFPNPEAYLDTCKGTLEELSDDPRFHYMPEEVVLHAVLGYPEKSEEFLINYGAKIQKLTKDSRFRHLPLSIMNLAVFSDPQSPETYLKSYITSSH